MLRVLAVSSGEMSEWFKELVLKTSDPARGRGFESHSLRHFLNCCEFDLEKYPRGRRGSPAKGVGRETGARVQIPPSPPRIRAHPIGWALILSLEKFDPNAGYRKRVAKQFKSLLLRQNEPLETILVSRGFCLCSSFGRCYNTS